jgi:hypothetical protein
MPVTHERLLSQWDDGKAILSPLRGIFKSFE